MNESGHIGPDQGNYAADVAALASRMIDQPQYVTLIARSTRIELLLAYDFSLQALPRPEGLDEGRWVFAAVRGHGAYWLRLDSYLAPEYVAERLRVSFGDGASVAELLTRIGIALGTKENVHA